MLNIASYSASGLCTVNLGLTLHIYIGGLVCKGINHHICIYTGYIYIYWDLQQYMYPMYIYLVYSFISLHAYFILHIYKCKQIYANACSIAHHPQLTSSTHWCYTPSNGLSTLAISYTTYVQ